MRTDMTKLIVAFRNSSNALNIVIENYKKELLKSYGQPYVPRGYSSDFSWETRFLVMWE